MTAAARVRFYTCLYGIRVLKVWHLGRIVCELLSFPHHHLKKICPASFRETCQGLKFPSNGLRAQSRVSQVVGLLPLATGPASLGMAFTPFLNIYMSFVS
jgi:hypothetical protein